MLQSKKPQKLTTLNLSKNNHRLLKRDFNHLATAEIKLTLGHDEIALYKSCYVSGRHFKTANFFHNKKIHDSCVLFNVAGETFVGFIMNIMRLVGNEILFRIQQVSVKDKFHLKMKQKKITCSNVFHGSLNQTSGFLFVQPDAVIEKLVYVYDAKMNAYIFFRVPNLLESS